MGFLPEEDQEYLVSKGVVYEEVEENGVKGLILREYTLPDDRYDAKQVDILIQLPSGYPDVAPDMFYLLPWVRLASNNEYPSRADQPCSFNGQTWQRWSRHNNEWRPGVDTIRTVIKRIENALEKAT